MLGSVLFLFGLIAAAPAPAAAPASAVVAVHALAAQAAAALPAAWASRLAMQAEATPDPAQIAPAAPAADQADADPVWSARMVRGCVRIGRRVSC